MNTDGIKKQILLAAPRSKVWKAITNSSEFGAWFGMKLEGPFIAGQTIKGTIAPTQVDPEVAKLQEPHTGKPVEMFVDSIVPETKFCLKWHPFAIDPKVDYSKEPMTLITFTLEEQGTGTLLTITETGFDKIPISRRAEALKANDGGWAHQCILLQKYLSRG
ncbi:MAG: SRPBCC family protein [Bdellovibrionales bacterium]|nr:SRPBCC family protein [Bdellovibrionales bacterium]